MSKQPDGVPYATIGNRVWLGRVAPSVRRRAKCAGLKPITMREHQRLTFSMQAIHRMMVCGSWYDSVYYP